MDVSYCLNDFAKQRQMQQQQQQSVIMGGAPGQSLYNAYNFEQHHPSMTSHKLSPGDRFMLLASQKNAFRPWCIQSNNSAANEPDARFQHNTMNAKCSSINPLNMGSNSGTNVLPYASHQQSVIMGGAPGQSLYNAYNFKQHHPSMTSHNLSPGDRFMLLASQKNAFRPWCIQSNNSAANEPDARFQHNTMNAKYSSINPLNMGSNSGTNVLPYASHQQSVIMGGAPSQSLYNAYNFEQHHPSMTSHNLSPGDRFMLLASQKNAFRPWCIQSNNSAANEPDVGFQHDTMNAKYSSINPLNMGSNSGTNVLPYASHQDAIINQHEQVAAFLQIEAKLCARLKNLSFCDPVSHIYNPLEYASNPHAHYVSKYCGTKLILFLGMNPGPFGMAQNGVPFGDTPFVKDWLNISGQVRSPENEHPKRPIQGLEYTKREESGKRFWRFMSKICQTPEKFFGNCFVHNYCPLVFITKTGKNVTPAALPAENRKALEAVCDSALLECIRVLRVQIIVGVGKYAADRATHVLSSSGDESLASIRVKRILHPSPASPQANSGWEEVVTRQLRESGILQFITSSCSST